MMTKDKLNDEWAKHLKIFLDDYYGEKEYEEQLQLFKTLNFSELINNNSKYSNFPLDGQKINYFKKTGGENDIDSIYLLRVVYCLVWGDYQNNCFALPNLTDANESFGTEGGYGCETINTYSTCFGSQSEKIKYYDFDDEEKNIIELFRKRYLTIGNFMVLPKKEKNESGHSLNQIKGWKKYGYKDFADLFFYDLFETDILDRLKKGNNEFYFENINAKIFCKKNFLELYFNTENKYKAIKNVFAHKLTEKDKTDKDFLLDFAKKSIAIIDYRADRICEILKERLK